MTTVNSLVGCIRRSTAGRSREGTSPLYQTLVRSTWSACLVLDKIDMDLLECSPGKDDEELEASITQREFERTEVV